MYSSTLLWTLASLSTLVEAAPLQARQYPTTSSGKRGLAFPKENNGVAGSSYTQYFSGSSKVTWMYDWEAVIDGTPASNLEFVPLLHDAESWCTQGWFDNVASARKQYNVQSILGFNEPDQVGGGGTAMAVGDAVNAWNQYIQPLAAQGLKLGSPAVTNGVTANMGMNWLNQFIAACQGCQFDFMVTHYYAPADVDAFKSYITQFYQTYNKPIWITEFGVTSGDADSFLQQVLPWMDSQSWIVRYAYQMTAPSTGSNQWLLNAGGNGLSSTGQVYAST